LIKPLQYYCANPLKPLAAAVRIPGCMPKEFFVHLDVETMDDRPLTIDKRGLNAILPHDIAIKNIIQVHPDAHARFDATLRSYEYHIHFEKDPFLNGYSWLLRDKPDLELMNQAAAIVMEYTDFSCFSKSNTQVKTNNCKIVKAEWVETENGIVFHISADRFLRNMVRAIVGTLMMVGKGEMQPEGIRQIIESKNRQQRRYERTRLRLIFNRGEISVFAP
jgi:tRNA pseudouridine38-40 synthase